MTQKDKAKRYDEVLKQIKECTPDENGFVTIYPNEIFPELVKSEDEKIRQEIMDYLKSQQEISSIQSSMYDTWLTWLKKQGENPTDEEMKELLQTEYEKGRADALADLRTE